ncbi:hypothetical protein L804_02948 [Cryptococcus deuterogattii 2001/935-1]|nr:hypothetical protein L804_02948 [Cryptococcus deuterogattii 2001/935-1]
MFIRSYTLGDFLDSAYLGSGAEIFGLQDFRFPDPAPIPEFFSIAGVLQQVTHIPTKGLGL